MAEVDSERGDAGSATFPVDVGAPGSAASRSAIGARVARIVGAASVSTGVATRAWAVCGTAPAAVVRPRSVDEVAALLALASEEGWRVEAAGAGTNLNWGRPPQRLDLVISTAGLADVLEYQPGDLTVGAGAGMPLGRLQQQLAEARQWLPWDPPTAEGATLGAIVSHAVTGPLRCGYGLPRDYVLGLQAVTGDGRVLQLGGRVVKNVAGYDLGKLLVGSRGTLAVLTAVHLRLRALPERDVTLALLADSASPLVEVAAGMRELAVEPAAAELLSPAAAAAVMGEPSWVLVLRLHGSAEVVADEESRLDGLAGAAVRRLQLPALPATSLWTGLGKLESNSTAVFRLADRPASLGMTRERAARLAQSAEAAGGVLLAHALDGIVRVLLRPAADAGQLRAIAETAAALRAEIAASGGSLILAKGPADLYGLLDPFGPAGPTLRLMQGLKSTFDPRGVLAPGRFL